MTTAAPTERGRERRTIPPSRARQRAAAWCDPVTGAAIGEYGVTAPGAALNPPLNVILRSLPREVEVVYLTGPRPGDGTAAGCYRWFTAELMQHAPTWRQVSWRESHDAPVIKLEHGTGQKTRRVEVRRAEEWFGEDATPPQCHAAALMLRRLLAREFGEHSVMLTSPGMTGTDTWDRCQKEYDWPPLPAPVRRLILETSGQGRHQLIRHAGELPALVHLDARLAYAALCSELSAGAILHHDHRNEFAGYAPARYRVRFTVPTEWAHVGLLPVRITTPNGKLWSYPNKPGEVAETWCDGAELHVAMAHNWPVTILERIVFRSDGARPLDTWRDKLVRLRARAAATSDPAVRELVAGAVRNILLHGIGRFARGARREDVHLAEGRTLGDYRLSRRDVIAERKHPAGNGWLITVERPLDRWSERFTHPEWAAHIWARQRARVLSGPQKTGVLHLPAESVVALQTDALYLTADPEWPDDGKPGRFRLKGRSDGPVRAPQSWAELHALRDTIAIHRAEPT